MTSTVIIFAISCVSLVFSANVPATQVSKTTAPASDEKSASVLEKIPILELLQSPKVVAGYTGCLLEKGPCTPDAAEVKHIMSNAMTKKCSKCTPMQKQVFEKLILHYNEKQPEVYKEVAAKYDPKDKFKSQLGNLKKAEKTVKKQ